MKKTGFVLLSLVLAAMVVVQPKAAKASSSASGLYNAIYKAFNEVDSEITVTKYHPSTTTAANTINAVLQKHPEIFYYKSGQYKYTKTSSGKITSIKLRFTYTHSKSTILKMKKTLNSTANQIIRKHVKSSYSSFQKTKAIHDYIVTHNTYNAQTQSGTYKYNTAYSALIEKKSACNGYAQAMQLLLNKTGVKNYYVYGKANNGKQTELHAWNLVKMNGKYYHVDATWDDYPKDHGRVVSYQYFGVTDGVMKKNHSWSTKGLPKATSTNYQYMWNMLFPVKKGDYIYYSNAPDKKLYRIKENGTGKKRITGDRALWLNEKNGWIYFSDYSRGGYIYKIKTDGSRLTKMNNVWSQYLYIKGSYLYYTNGNNNKTYKIKIG